MGSAAARHLLELGAASAVPAARSDDGGASLAQVGCDEAVAPGAIVDGVAALRSTARAASNSTT